MQCTRVANSLKNVGPIVHYDTVCADISFSWKMTGDGQNEYNSG